MEGLSHKRLCNLIIYVLMDQIILTEEAIAQSKEADPEMVKMHDAVSQMREKLNYISEIEDWVQNHLNYLDKPLDSLDPHYYELITDAICIIYYDDYNHEHCSGTEYAFECERKYYKYKLQSQGEN